MYVENKCNFTACISLLYSYIQDSLKVKLLNKQDKIIPLVYNNYDFNP